jgi:ADP-ribosylglycohydrolase
MLPSKDFLRKRLEQFLCDQEAQGSDISGMHDRLKKLSDSYDALLKFAEEAVNLPMRPGWAYVEPLSWEEIEKEMDPKRDEFLSKPGDITRCSKHAEAAFLGSVLGCILGKPIEVNPTLQELKAAGEKVNEWPINDFISVNFLEKLGRRHPDWIDTVKEKIRYVAADDDLHYSVMGMLNLEKYGLELDLDGVKNTWLNHQCMNFVWGPERYILACIGVDHLSEGDDPEKHKGDEYYLKWSSMFNPGSELCGAAIRADAYGYAFPGRPDLAARYSYIDASFTHRRTGVYSAMFIAAAIALMSGIEKPLLAFEGALKFVPRRSRFFYNAKLCFDFVKNSPSFDEAYQRIHQRFREYGHCKVYQEIGTLMNTVHFADGIWDGVCKQVMQGNDTDSFGCTAGSLLGMYFGPEGLPKEKLALFNDEIRLSLASFHEHSLSSLARRMGGLPKRFVGK